MSTMFAVEVKVNNTNVYVFIWHNYTNARNAKIISPIRPPDNANTPRRALTPQIINAARFGKT